MQDCDTKIHLMRILSRLKFVVESEEMNRKQLIALPAIMVATTTMSTISEASNTRWHMGIDIGMAQYKQERKQNKYPKYKDVNEILDKEIRTIEVIQKMLTDASQLALEYHAHKIANTIAHAQQQIQAARNMPQKRQKFESVLQLAGYTDQEIGYIIVNNVPGVAANNLEQAQGQMLDFLNNNFDKKIGLGVSGNEFHLLTVENFANHMPNILNNLRNKKNTWNNLRTMQGADVEDLLSKDVLKKYDEMFFNDLFAFSAFLNGQNTDECLQYVDWLMNDRAAQNYATTNNWYGRNNHPTHQAVIQSFNEIRKAQDDYTKLLKDIVVKRQETEKVSSGRINSPVVEANFGVTTYCGSAVFGAEMLVGINCKEFGKKKKTDTYTQKRTPVYASVIGRAGFLLGDTVEPYVLAGLRLNKTAPIAGVGARIYTSNAKSSFFKAEFQKTLGKKKYPRGWTAKLGFGWTL